MRKFIWMIALGFGFLAGYKGSLVQWKSNEATQQKLQSLRLEGFNFTSPLLACDTTRRENSEELKHMETQLMSIISESKRQGALEAASIYFRDFKNGNTLTINGGEKYDPASLIKIPAMIIAYKSMEIDQAFEKKQVTAEILNDENGNQEIRPRVTLEQAKNYSIEDIIRLMIVYSDNNAYWQLTKLLDFGLFRKAFADLKIPYAEDYNENDLISVDDFSYFLRVLYNATYLNKEYSERALQLLSEVDFHEGLVAGLPENIPVAHKFGLRGKVKEDGTIDSRELHDCGIVYTSRGDYLLCVMTKSKAAIPEIETVIKEISQKTYTEFIGLP